MIWTQAHQGGLGGRAGASKRHGIVLVLREDVEGEPEFEGEKTRIIQARRLRPLFADDRTPLRSWGVRPPRGMCVCVCGGGGGLL